jgi:small-conductance mechanosensitive channel
MLAAVPLLIVPFLIYNLGLAGVFGQGMDGDPWAGTILSVNMMSGGVFSMTLGDLMIVIALIFFFVEVLKSTRTSNASILDHLLSTFVFVAFLVEFLLVKGAAHPVFFILMVITLIDVLAGFSVSLRSAGRDVNLH